MKSFIILCRTENHHLCYNLNMLVYLLCALAFGETLYIDAKIPAALYIDGQAFVEFSQPGRAEFAVAAGEHKLVIMTNGNPTERTVNFDTSATRLVIGRTGISVGEAAARPQPKEDAEGTTTVELRSTSRLPLLITLGDDRHMLAAGATKALSLNAGDHPIKVRNDAGTAIFATGTLRVHGTHEVVLQLSEGRVPEVSGDGAEFVSRADD